MKEIATALIGNSEWMVEDLDVIVSNDDKPLKLIETETEWENAFQNQEPAYKKSMHNRGGLLYNYYAMRIVIPSGWRLASEDDYANLSQVLNDRQDDINNFGFKNRAGFAYCNNEDEDNGAYWCDCSIERESWGTNIENLSIKYFADYTKWGCLCNYGLFIRCLKK
jgi:uncharacterized protein (TIGR02145 family)